MNQDSSHIICPTMELRFVERDIPDGAPGFSRTVRILQQGWQDQKTGKITWRDIPLKAENP